MYAEQGGGRLSREEGPLKVDWGRTREDYARYRMGPPEALYALLAAFGVGLPGQRILDLGTGTGALGRALLSRGARVCGIDPAALQLSVARELAPKSPWLVAVAEALPFRAASFDALTAHQCALYFDKLPFLAEARRVLCPGGRIATSHHSWLPREDPVAAASEALILEHNPHWSLFDWDGVVPEAPVWSKSSLRVVARAVFDVPIPFSAETWRGRVRASRGVGATLSPEGVLAFDRAHAELLARQFGPEFSVLHRVDCHVFEFLEASGSGRTVG